MNFWTQTGAVPKSIAKAKGDKKVYTIGHPTHDNLENMFWF